MLEAAAGRFADTETVPDGVAGRSTLPWSEAHSAAVSGNREAMEHIRQGNIEQALRVLKHVKELLDDSEKLSGPEDERALFAVKADTESNIGVCYKRAGSHDLATRHLSRALQLHKSARVGLRTLVAAHLNLAACHLEAGSPSKSLKHALAAVELGGQLIATQDSQEDEHGQSSQPQSDNYAMLAVAYHKAAEAQEGLREWGKATFAYTQAYEVVKRSLGPNHHLTKAFEKSSRCPPQSPSLDRMPYRSTLYNQGCDGARTHRLPNIPSARSRHFLEETKSYCMSDDVFPSWPPQYASREEHLWYSMAKKHSEQQRSSGLNKNPPREPMVESFTASAGAGFAQKQYA